MYASTSGLSSVEVKDSSFDPALALPRKGKPPVSYRMVGEREFYKVWIYLDGQGVSFVEDVTYELHPSFGERVHRAIRSPSNPSCSLIIWTWGTFDVRATIRDRKGRVYEAVHPLTYDQDWAKTDINWVLEEGVSHGGGSRAFLSAMQHGSKA